MEFHSPQTLSLQNSVQTCGFSLTYLLLSIPHSSETASTAVWSTKKSGQILGVDGPGYELNEGLQQLNRSHWPAPSSCIN
jgi:hypothetical protein